MRFILKQIKWVTLVVILLINLTTKAELVKGKTIGYSSIGGEAIIELSDSARVFPYEPGYGKWRLVMWAGYVDTGSLISTASTKAQTVGYDFLSFDAKSVLLKETALYQSESFYNPLKDKKRVIVYAYILEESIRDDSRMEPRLEKVLKTKKKKKWQAFETFKTDFGFVDAVLIENKVTLHFVYDQRSPFGENDFRLLVFSNPQNKIIAVAHEGYRNLKFKSKSKFSLDRKLTIYFIKKTDKQLQQQIKNTFIEAYRYRDY